jgi:hypothetical protein
VGPDFTGDATVTFTGQATESCNYPVLYDIGTVSTPCYSYPYVLVAEPRGVSQNLTLETTSVSTTPFTVTSNPTAYIDGVSVKSYSCVASFENLDETDDPDEEHEIIEGVNPVYNDPPWSGVPCGEPLPTVDLTTYVAKSSKTETLYFYVDFSWLGVAQRDLPGIRVQRVTGVTSQWLVKVDSGVVRIYREDGTDSYETSGTLNQVVANINSALSGKITARVCGWGGYPFFGETNGDVASGKSEYDYLFTKNDPSTMLKDLGPTYIRATFCNDLLAPVNWRNSTRLPVYFRGDTLPPRGVVSLAMGGNGQSYLMNSRYATRPELKQYENTEEGAFSFITEAVYPKTQTATWGGVSPVGPSFYGSWLSVLEQLDDLSNQTRYNPGTSTIVDNIYPYSGPVSIQLVNIVLLGTCPIQPFPNPDDCPDVTGNICVPDQQCFCCLYCPQSGCYTPSGGTPLWSCSFEGEPCTAYYETVENGDLLSITPPDFVQSTHTVSSSIRIS